MGFAGASRPWLRSSISGHSSSEKGDPLDERERSVDELEIGSGRTRSVRRSLGDGGDLARNVVGAKEGASFSEVGPEGSAAVPEPANEGRDLRKLESVVRSEAGGQVRTVEIGFVRNWSEEPFFASHAIVERT